ncbi:hypothetical protein GY45DRAFT_373757 [Cubamyces sp. BRFM 1775]|nr:hypothetical protein GY45DRAFT_373757 [Cubamyces sp. BRFM 1775]
MHEGGRSTAVCTRCCILPSPGVLGNMSPFPDDGLHHLREIVEYSMKIAAGFAGLGGFHLSPQRIISVVSPMGQARSLNLARNPRLAIVGAHTGRPSSIQDTGGDLASCFLDHRQTNLFPNRVHFYLRFWRGPPWRVRVPVYPQPSLVCTQGGPR